MKRLLMITVATMVSTIIGVPAQAQNAPLPASTPEAAIVVEYGYGPNFWRGAPATVAERLTWLDMRLKNGMHHGLISDADAAHVTRMLQQTRAVHERLLMRDNGQLTQRDNDYMQHRLDNMSTQVRWARDNGMDRHSPG